MTPLELQPWPKIARLNRDITITEKIDGTNAAVVIVPLDQLDLEGTGPMEWAVIQPNLIGVYGSHGVFAQSRTRFITPEQDNYGFAGWVKRNAQTLVETLGAGTHFGEWWGAGIQRKYGLTGSNKRFSLFNTARWEDLIDPFEDHPEVPGLRRVPLLYKGAFSQERIDGALEELRHDGSHAEEGFMRPEGIVVWHDAARQSFKATLEGDEAPKALPRDEHDNTIGEAA